MKKQFIDGFNKTSNQKGYVLPFVIMISTLTFFLLSHQISLYLTESKFYLEQVELTKMDRILQKMTKDLKEVIEDSSIHNKEIHYEEGTAFLMIDRSYSTYVLVKVRVQTINKRKALIIIHYDPIRNKILKWIEGR